MELLHLTQKRNIKSIIRNGLSPSRVNLSHHLGAFQDDGLVGDKALYLWDPSQGGSVDKTIKDFIYCKHFIHPRNKMMEYAYDNDLPDVDYDKVGTKLFGDAEDWVLLKINVDETKLLNAEYLHSQTTESDKYSSTFHMNSKYEHDDKLLKISNDIIHRGDFKIINELSTRFYKDDTIGVSYKRPPLSI